MDSFFGEIIEPTSRAFWDDYDEEQESEADNYYKPPQWCWLNKIKAPEYPTKLKKFVVCEGIGIKDFISTSILRNTPPICRLDNNLVSVHYFPAHELCVCLSEAREQNEYGPLTNMLLPWLKIAETVLTLSFQPKALHKGTTNLDAETIVMVRSVGASLKDVQSLKEPNFITGIAAGVASWRSFDDKAASSFIFYMDSMLFDSISAAPILKILKTFDIPCVDKYECSMSTQSNLYL